jgi:asparagine synthetase B (glutamine-hydrolysing)
MIAAIVGGSDEEARDTVDRMGRVDAAAKPRISSGRGVTLVAWTGGRTIPTGFDGDRAHVGDLRDGPPSPGRALRGDFALVARVGDGLRLARGRFGGRPLYWMVLGRRIVASDRLLAVALAARERLELDVRHLLAVFDARFLLHEAPLPFVGAQRVRSNTLLDIDASASVREHTGPVAFDDELRVPPRAIAGALREKLDAAVARSSTGARTIAVFGGGGVDSSHLLSAAVHNQRRGSASVLAFALDYPGPGDDTPHVRANARHLGIDPVIVPPRAGAGRWREDMVVDATAHSTVPLSMALVALARARDAGAERALFGDCSEALLDDHQGIFANFLAASPLLAVAAAARRRVMGESHARTLMRFLVGPLARGALPGAFEARYRWLQARNQARRARAWPWAGPRLRAHLTESRSYRPLAARTTQRERIEALASSPSLMMPREHLSRWEVAGGLPIHLPYLDDDFVCFTARIPDRAFFATDLERGLLRESMRGRVPESVRTRMDKATPYRAMAILFEAAGGRASVEDLLAMRGLEALGIVDPSQFERAFEAFAADPYAPTADWHGLWGAITAESYVRWFHRFMAENTAGSGRRTPAGGPRTSAP